jgi:CRP-like cAMP-binding protein
VFCHHYASAVPTETRTLVESLAQLALFVDLTQPQLEEVAHTVGEEMFAEGQRVVRQGMSGGGFFVILDGEAQVLIDGEERARLGRGDFFGEVAALTGDTPSADVVAATLLRCLTVPTAELEPFLLEHPRVMYRMLQAEARRVRSANLWPR